MLPRLLYVGDVAVEASYHGSALLHRLLSHYPPERLTIVETATQSEKSRRLPQVKYLFHPIANMRWLNTRFHPYATVWFTNKGKHSAPQICESLNGLNFDSVLTVAHGFGWLAASAIASRATAPLHLVVHDDWPMVANITPAFRHWLERRFAKVCCQARSRLCVSTAMSRIYEKRYAAQAQVMYPTRAVNSPAFAGPPARVGRNDHAFTVAFAGTINTEGYVRALVGLQEALKPIDGRLLIFGPLTSNEARRVGLNDRHTQIRGLLSTNDLMTSLRDEADALFAPMSFDPADRPNMETAFPSKLADYTAMGLPLLIYGPSYCSAIGWARENPGVAEIVECEAELDRAITLLADNPNKRLELGKNALIVGQKYFAHDRVREQFYAALSA